MLRYIVICLFSLSLVACGQVTPFEVGQQQYVNGNYLMAAQTFKQHTSWNSDIKYEAMYYEGMCWFNLKSYDKARVLFTNVIQYSENRAIKAKAIAAKAELCMLSGDCDCAISLYRMLLLAGYVDYYPQDEAYRLLRKSAIQCGNTSVLEEYEGRFGAAQPQATNSLSTVSGLKRVRLETQFTNKTEAMSAMKSLKDAGVDSSLIRISAPTSEYYLVQVGAFSNIENANSMAQQVFDLGWKAVIVE